MGIKYVCDECGLETESTSEVAAIQPPIAEPPQGWNTIVLPEPDPETGLLAKHYCSIPCEEAAQGGGE